MLFYLQQTTKKKILNPVVAVKLKEFDRFDLKHIRLSFFFL